MKAVFTFFLAISFSMLGFAQQNVKETKAATLSFEVVSNPEINIQKITIKETKLARVYMFRNSRVKKALAFKTKRNRSKMA